MDNIEEFKHEIVKDLAECITLTINSNFVNRNELLDLSRKIREIHYNLDKTIDKMLKLD